MSGKQDMLKEMRALWKRDAALFDEIAREYSERGPAVFPRDKNKRTKRQKVVMDWVWASVEFLRWRDGMKVRPACEYLAKHMTKFELHDTENGMWRRGTPRPEIFHYHPDGEGDGLAPGESIRQTYYTACKQPDMGIATLLLHHMQAVHEGRPSVLDERHLPPKV